MPEPYWHDDTATLYSGDPREVLAEMPDQAVDCIVSAPPSCNPEPDSTRAHQELPRYGHEPTPALYVAAIRRVLAEAHRVLANEGTCWLVLSDRYADETERRAGPPAGRHARRIRDHAMIGLPVRTLIGLPWQLAFALQDDGWIVRNVIILHHPDARAEPPLDRLAATYKLILLLVKQRGYYFDVDAVREGFHHPRVAVDPRAIGSIKRAAGCIGARAPGRSRRRRTHRHGAGAYGVVAENCRSRQHGPAMPPTGQRHAAALESGRNSGDVWTVPVPLSGGAAPVEVPLRCVAVGCRPGGTVLDMFTEDATTGIAARRLGRSFIGVGQTSDLCRTAERRLRQEDGRRGHGDTP
ncbi:hypothetical protein E1287_24460 [Actinomadura sp. KC06]|uniref:DNA-methyltransferase n=1 Tax=Actinomadura sp. KC06 TaxID=2530369 RepID=UPI0010491B69|nr:DNA methyltransferase [Actinomadura sp. KC06]TDD32018.1 hypothetical protein E1287_24460 [Actinomadura sp. KC06]